IGHVSPEAAAGGPIGLLRDGDIIAVDIPGQRLSVQLDDAELDRRRASYSPQQRSLTGYLRRYAAQVTSATTGAVLK
ncbi:MAG: dihydroxy-acid dehydratase, partial [Phycisphaerae bacterium]|nr:dihydroxy-acid dehydratase [Phycisphaerae bacterium]